MRGNQLACTKCGRPFMSPETLDRVLRALVEAGLTQDREALSMCPECRREAHFHRLIGDKLARTPKTQHVTERRSERLKPIKTDDRTGATVYKTQCFICNSGCDATVWVKDDRLFKVQGDPSSKVTKGTMCAKGLASKHLYYHEGRLKHPLKRVGARGEGQWRRISWDEALDTIATRFQDIEEQYGPDAIALSQGTARGWLPFFARFANAWGKQWTGPGIAQCALPRSISSYLLTGTFFMECPDYQTTECMMVWASNPPATWPTKALGIMEARSRGAKLIVVDPIFSETASKADLWLQIRPATDAALALGMLNVIIEEELYDQAFVERWCHGFEDLKKRVADYPLDRVEAITWIPKEKIVQAARLYAGAKPASITQCLAIDQNADTISTSTAMAMLAALTGNIDVPGGNLIMMPMPIVGFLEYCLAGQLTPEQHQRRLGGKDYPLLAGAAGPFPSAHNHALWQAVLTDEPFPVRAIYCHGNNMLLAYSNTKMVTEALMSLDFLVVADLFMTPTAKIADIVLPAGSWMERSQPHENNQISYNNIHLQQKVLQLEECWSDYKILLELAKRLGFSEKMFNTPGDFYDYLLSPSGKSWEEFTRLGVMNFPFEYRKYEQGGFSTRTGKVELSSTMLEGLGFDPLPSYREPTESPYSNPDLAEEYPLILTTGGREPVFRHSELRNIPVLKEIWPEPKMKIHPQTASAHGIRDGDMVIVETLRGDMEALAWLREDIDPRVVQVPSHWPGRQNVNRVMDNESCAPIVGGTNLKSQLCRIRKGTGDPS